MDPPHRRVFFLEEIRYTERDICRGGETGKHARFRTWCRKAWRFDSSPRHSNSLRSLRTTIIVMVELAIC